MLPLDLHVLSLPLAFILSQDQTLHRCSVCWIIQQCITILALLEFVTVHKYNHGLLFNFTLSISIFSMIVRLTESNSLKQKPINFIPVSGCKYRTSFDSDNVFLKLFWTFFKAYSLNPILQGFRNQNKHLKRRQKREKRIVKNNPLFVFSMKPITLLAKKSLHWPLFSAIN